ncbi:MAG: lactonase family protein [Opitutales bacterium]|nr:lactonase family protein [Opitutales bacterium]MDP5079657.1 lactonase family protein [Opitutales bacterium]
MPTSIVYIGTYTRPLEHVDGCGEGIYTIQLDHKTGAMSALNPPVAAPNSSYLCQSRNGEHLYAIGEVYDYANREDGCLNVFATGDALTQKQECSSTGRGPAYIRIDQSGRWLMCANYTEGNLAVYPIQKNGSLGRVNQSIQLNGSGSDTVRQDGPHPHSIVPSSDNRFVYVADLGTDQIRGYHFDAANGQLSHDDALDLKAKPKSGPRHFIFHPNSALAYYVQELSSEVSVCRVDPLSGKLSHMQTLTTLPVDSSSISHCSEICISRDGRHLYVANRGHDSIAQFNVQPDGRLITIGHTDCLGHIPRHICLSLDDQYLLVANQESHQIVSFRRDASTGNLHSTQQAINIPTPGYIEFKH